MFYVIALAGAHKRVINQLREQLAMVGLLTNWWCLNYFAFCLFSVFITHCPYSYYQSSDPLCVPFCPLGGPWQAFPDPKAVPGTEAFRCQISCVQIPAPQEEQFQLPHQLLQQFQWKCVSGTSASWLFHTCVREEAESTDSKIGQMVCSRKMFWIISEMGFF